MSPDRKSLEKQLQRARRYCDFLREQKAGYGLRVPADLELELEEKEQEVADLEAQLRELEPTLLTPVSPEEERRIADARYLRHQGHLCSDDRVEGMAQQQFLIPQLDEVFVPLELSAAFHRDTAFPIPAGFGWDESLYANPDGLSIWDLLRQGEEHPPFRRLVILAWGGYGKTTLLRHVTYCYARGKLKPGVPKLLPAFIRLRDWGEAIAKAKSLKLSTFLKTKHIPSLSEESLALPDNWAKERLESGQMLIMLDGFDEVKPEWRSKVSTWIGQQLKSYPEARFILTSRPNGYGEGYKSRYKPDVQLYVKSFNQQQQKQFVQQWYWCQERIAKGGRDTPDVKAIAARLGRSLVAELAEREELRALARNPLMLNMIAHLHRAYEGGRLPSRRSQLYQRIFRLQLVDRPFVKGVEMLLEELEILRVLQAIALDMVCNNEVELDREVLRDRLQIQLDIVQPGETVEAIAFLEQMEQVSEVLVKKDECYEFAHLSFQGYLAAVEIKQRDREDLLFDNWRSDKWKETILLYTAQQKNPAPFIRRLIEVGGQEAIALAYECLKESPKAGDEAIMAEIESLRASVQDSRYRQLEEYLKAEQFREADQETARLMLETVGKDMSQFLLVEDIENFPCEELRAIDKLWVDHSGGKFGFSVQSRIYHRLGGTKEYNNEVWLKFASKVGWRVEGVTSRVVEYSQLNFSLQAEVGHLPFCCGGQVGLLELMVLLSRRDVWIVT